MDEPEVVENVEVMEPESRPGSLLETDARIPDPFVNLALDAMGLALVALGVGMLFRK